MAKRENRTEPGWYKLDNAGVLYSALQREDYSAVYRFSAWMTEKVNPDALQRAVSRTMPRFPGFRVRLLRGLFWYYLEPNDAPGPFVKKDVSNPCQPIRFGEDNHWLIRFYYYDKRISVEIFHALSDGAGAMIFLRTLLSVYLRELGCPDIPREGPGLLNVDLPPAPEETENAYARYATVRAVRSGWEKAAYRNTGTPAPFYTLNVIHGMVPLDQLRSVAKGYGASVTEYLGAVLIESIIENQKSERPYREKPVTLAVPVNLRTWFPSDTLRNFMLNLRPGVDPSLGDYSLQEIVRQVHHFMHLYNDCHRLQGIMANNVGYQRNRVLKMVPVVLKNPLIAFSYKLLGTRPFSANYTNPGPFPVPPGMEPHITRVAATLGQSFVPRPNCTVLSYKNTVTITFAGTMWETDTERRFFRRLVRDGIHVFIESNREEALICPTA